VYHPSADRGKPELTQRFAAIAKLASEPDLNGRIRSADEVESLLVEEVRKLGNQTLASWAEGVDSLLGEQVKASFPSDIISANTPQKPCSARDLRSWIVITPSVLLTTT
jgi:hypothetical protein